MDISVPSRFSCLKIEGEERISSNRNQAKKSANNITKTKKQSVTGGDKKQTKDVTRNCKKQSTVKTQKKVLQEKQQWEDWIKRDSEAADQHFEQDLHSAIVQSKIAFEKDKKSSIPSASNDGKKKKSKTMNLVEFLDGNTSINSTDKKENVSAKNEKRFLQSMLKAARNEVTKGKVEEQRKVREINIEKTSILQLEEKLRQEQENNAELERKLAESKTEIASVKARNRKLCSILGQGEMRDKAEVLLELERLTVVKDELTEEVSKLHELLEQTRSKTAPESQTSSAKQKEKKVKKNR